MSDRHRLGALLTLQDALEVGDYYLAGAIIQGLLDDVDAPLELPYQCRTCGLRFEWPGQLDDHERFTHWRAAA
jgi:hypothetical protein